MTPEVMKQYPEASMIEATRKVGELYKKLPEEEKLLLKETDKPLRPPSAYFLFIRDAREIALKSRKKPETNAERRKFIDECAQKWKQMSEQEKQHYLKLVAKQYEDFQAKMSVWEKGMIEAGMESLVRKTTRKKMNIETTQEGQVKAKANKRGTKTKVKSTRSKGKVKVETTGT
ncbi:hypothetical protein DPMN_024198 [Dreissena polymorpha]|uniref:HMG box domain-containing protein n=1 Tax=Dreissena polymorpha TaxID=45954 RepID=A0A9D4RAK1_DREPO|nr:hypothetical protein DPMN_024198 [Dreissena polymorpha]